MKCLTSRGTTFTSRPRFLSRQIRPRLQTRVDAPGGPALFLAGTVWITVVLLNMNSTKCYINVVTQRNAVHGGFLRVTLAFCHGRTRFSQYISMFCVQFYLAQWYFMQSKTITIDSDKIVNCTIYILRISSFTIREWQKQTFSRLDEIRYSYYFKMISTVEKYFNISRRMS